VCTVQLFNSAQADNLLMNIFKTRLRSVFRFGNKTVISKKPFHLRLLDLHKHPLVIPVCVSMAFFFVACAGFIVMSGETIGANDAKVVSLFVDGQTRIVPTRANTVADVLTKAGVELRDGDVVEPASDSQIATQDFNINVYRARPVTVVDNKGAKVITKVIESTPAEMAKKAGVKVYPEDNVTIAAPADALRDGVIGAKVVIDRATPAVINLYGTSIPARSHATTVGDLLKEKGIKTLDGDTVQPSPETPLTDNTLIFIVRFGKQVISTEEEIPAPVEKISDASLPIGSTSVKDPGAPGRKVVTYEIELQNNKEVSRKAIQEVVALEPVKRVVAQGTKFVISDPSANVLLGQQIAADMGYADQFHCIYQIFQRESGWRTNAGNPARAYGIPQALPGSKMGPGWETDPSVQIRWGINYMKKYGGPCGAWEFWQLHHYY
jgi:uncharacterized protein YabE (DUF348 family)